MKWNLLWSSHSHLMIQMQGPLCEKQVFFRPVCSNKAWGFTSAPSHYWTRQVWTLKYHPTIIIERLLTTPLDFLLYLYEMYLCLTWRLDQIGRLRVKGNDECREMTQTYLTGWIRDHCRCIWQRLNTAALLVHGEADALTKAIFLPLWLIFITDAILITIRAVKATIKA